MFRRRQTNRILPGIQFGPFSQDTRQSSSDDEVRDFILTFAGVFGLMLLVVKNASFVCFVTSYLVLVSWPMPSDLAIRCLGEGPLE
jgi:hypothetical protein